MKEDKRRMIARVFLLVCLFMTCATQQTIGATFTDGETAYDNGDYAAAFRVWEPMAEQGNALAQLELAKMYLYGKGVPQDYKVATYWYTKAAEQGNARAQSNAGWMYANGAGVPKDYKHAVKWYTKAAEQGEPVAQYQLGMMYYSGEGVSQNFKEAVKWLTMAAEQGFAEAQPRLEEIYKHSPGAPQNYREADENEITFELYQQTRPYIYSVGFKYQDTDRWYQLEWKAFEGGEAKSKTCDVFYDRISENFYCTGYESMTVIPINRPYTLVFHDKEKQAATDK
jgi:TPR repeat protein